MDNKIISLEPDQFLIFKRPFNTVKTEILKIRNVTTSTVVFKVKTTAPKQYIVVPNCGEIKVGETKEVEIRLQTMSDDFASDFKCKDKFLVQSMRFSDEALDQVRSSPKELQALLMEKFQEVDKLKKINPADVKKILCEAKLNCVYVQPTGQNGNAEMLKVSQNTSSMTRNPAMATSTPSTTSEANNTTTNTSINNTNISTSATVNKKSTEEKNYKNILPASLTSAMDESFKFENLEEAREKIKELQKALNGYKQDQALQNKVKKEVNSSSTTQAVQKPKSENVIPVEIVAIVALIAFLIGAFCF